MLQIVTRNALLGFLAVCGRRTGKPQSARYYRKLFAAAPREHTTRWQCLLKFDPKQDATSGSESLTDDDGCVCVDVLFQIALDERDRVVLPESAVSLE